MATAQTKPRFTAQRPKNDAYVGLLSISLLALITSCVLMYLDYSQYGSQKPTAVPKAPAQTPGVVVPDASRPPEKTESPAPAEAAPMGGSDQPKEGSPMGDAPKDSNPMGGSSGTGAKGFEPPNGGQGLKPGETLPAKPGGNPGAGTGKSGESTPPAGSGLKPPMLGGQGGTKPAGPGTKPGGPENPPK
jgi:hypothetical protein